MRCPATRAPARASNDVADQECQNQAAPMTWKVVSAYKEAVHRKVCTKVRGHGFVEMLRAPYRTGISNSSRDDDISALLQAFNNLSRAEICVCADDGLVALFEQIQGVLRIADFGVVGIEMGWQPLFANILHFVEEVVALDVGDFEIQALFRDLERYSVYQISGEKHRGGSSYQFLHFLCQSLGVVRAAIDDDLDAFFG